MCATVAQYNCLQLHPDQSHDHTHSGKSQGNHTNSRSRQIIVKMILNCVSNSNTYVSHETTGLRLNFRWLSQEVFSMDYQIRSSCQDQFQSYLSISSSIELPGVWTNAKMMGWNPSPGKSATTQANPSQCVFI